MSDGSNNWNALGALAAIASVIVAIFFGVMQLVQQPVQGGSSRTFDQTGVTTPGSRTDGEQSATDPGLLGTQMAAKDGGETQIQSFPASAPANDRPAWARAGTCVVYLEPDDTASDIQDAQVRALSLCDNPRSLWLRYPDGRMEKVQ